MKKLAALTLSLFLMTGIAFADSPKDTPKDTPKETPKAADAQPAKNAPAAKPAAVKTNAEIAAEMEELRQALQAQQEQLQLLKEELAKRDKQIEEAREAAASANSRATEANVKATEAATTSAEVKSTETALNTSVANLEASNAAAAPTRLRRTHKTRRIQTKARQRFDTRELALHREASWRRKRCIVIAQKARTSTRNSRALPSKPPISRMSARMHLAPASPASLCSCRANWPPRI